MIIIDIISITKDFVLSIIPDILTKTFDTSSRKNIDYLLDMLLDCTRQFESAIEYNKYDIAINQADKMLNLIKDVYFNIKHLTYFPSKKKLILTYLYNIQRLLKIVKNVEMGYSEDNELSARCERIKNRYLYQINLHYTQQSFLVFTFEVLKELNRYSSVKKGLTEKIYIKNNDKIDVYVVYKELIEINSFRNKNLKLGCLKDEIFTQEEYQKYISKKLKRREINEQ